MVTALPTPENYGRPSSASGASDPCGGLTRRVNTPPLLPSPPLCPCWTDGQEANKREIALKGPVALTQRPSALLWVSF